MKIMENLVQEIEDCIKNSYQVTDNANKYVFKELKYEYKGFMVFSKECYSDDERKRCKISKEYKYENKYYKRRYYYVEKLKHNNDKKIIFILFNCSTSNPEKLDPSVKNCKWLADENLYSQIEILNLFSIRNSKADNIDINDLCDEDNYEFIKELLKHREGYDIVLAWGYGKECNKKKSSNHEKDIKIVERIIKFREEYLKNLSVNNTIKYLSYNFNTNEKDFYLKQRHPGDQLWNCTGGFKDFAILTDYNE